MSTTPFDNAQGQAHTGKNLMRIYTINDLREAFLRGVAETEARFAKGKDNWYRKGQDDERSQAATLVAAAQIAQERLMHMSHRSLISTVERVNGHEAAANLIDALANYQASQGSDPVEESHES